MKPKSLLTLIAVLALFANAPSPVLSSNKVAPNAFPESNSYTFDAWHLLSDGTKTENQKRSLPEKSFSQAWVSAQGSGKRLVLVNTLFAKHIRSKTRREKVRELIGQPEFRCNVSERDKQRQSEWYVLSSYPCGNATRRMLELSYVGEDVVAYRFFTSTFPRRD